MMTNLNLYHSLEAILALAGIWPVVMRLSKLDTPNPIESKIKLILISMCGLFGIRVFYEAFQFDLCLKITYAFANIVIFSTFLYFETLYRRHLPFIFKMLVTCGSLFFIIDALFFNMIYDKKHLIAFGIYGFIINASVIFIGITRKRSDYSKNENSLINLGLIFLSIAYLFFITDMKVFREMFIFPRLGVLGALLFTYACFHNQLSTHGEKSIAWKLTKSSFLAIFLVGTLHTLMPMHDYFFLGSVFIFIMNAGLILRIHLLAKALDADDQFFTFVNTVVEADKSQLLPFLRSTKTFFEGMDIKRLRDEDLTAYNVDRFHQFFQGNQTHLFTVFDLRNLLTQKKDSSSEHDSSLEVIEEMIDLLEKHEMSHICRVSIRHSVFVIFNNHLAGQSKVLFTETALISEISELIQSKEV